MQSDKWTNVYCCHLGGLDASAWKAKISPLSKMIYDSAVWSFKNNMEKILLIVLSSKNLVKYIRLKHGVSYAALITRTQTRG